MFFIIISPFLKNNRNLRSLNLCDLDMDARSNMAFVSALSRCNEKSLQQFDFHCSSGMDDESAAKLIDIMATHRNLRKLSLWFKDANQQWIVASGNLLQNPQSKLKELDLDDIHDEGAIALANGLATNSTLKRLSLEENDDITNIGWLAVAMSMLNPNSSIEQLNLSCKDIDDEAAAALANALVTSTKLKDLDLESNPSISNDGWRNSSIYCKIPLILH